MLQWLQLKLWECHGLRTVRRTLAQLAAQGSLAPDGTLLLQGTQPVSVVYFRWTVLCGDCSACVYYIAFVHVTDEGGLGGWQEEVAPYERA